MAHPLEQKVGFGVFLTLWNMLQSYSTPAHHAKIVRWLEKCWVRGDRRLLLLAFRASGKSTLTSLFSAWVLYRDPDLRILVLSAEARLASKMVRNIKKIIEKHPLTATLKPKKADQWASDRFTINRTREHRDPSVLSAGLYSNITGMRADVIICDDVEVPNTCDTAEKRRMLRERLLENEFILTPQGRQIYIGTPHTWDSIYNDKPNIERGQGDIFFKSATRLRVPILNAKGQSVWPERYDVDDIAIMKRQAGPNKFASQMMLTPVNITDGYLNTELLNRYDHEIMAQEIQQKLYLSLNGQKLVSCSAWWDPAFGNKDGSVLAVMYTNDVGAYFLHHLEYLKVSAQNTDEATAQCMRVCEIAKEFYIPSITIETNGLGKFLPAILRKTLAEYKIPCAVVEKTSTQPKDIRILEAFDAVMAARALHVHARVYETNFITEMNEWRPSVKGGHDDGLDAVAGALSLEPVRLKRTVFNGRQNWHTK